jgi:uncharacterized protein (UPF0333 family)
MTEKFIKCISSDGSSMNERGSIMLEFAFVFPILVVFALSGYNLMRDMEVNMLKRDFSRSLILSYQCADEKDATLKQSCYEAAVSSLTNYAKEKYILKKIIPAVPATQGNSGTPAREEAGDFAYSIHTYTISDIRKKFEPPALNAGATDHRFPINQERLLGCRSSISAGNSAILNAEITYEGGYSSSPTGSSFEGKYSKEKVQERAGGGNEKIRIMHLFPVDSVNFPKSAEAIRTVCLNGSITVAEVEFRLDKFFKFGRSPNSQNRYYEVSFL